MIHGTSPRIVGKLKATSALERTNGRKHVAMSIVEFYAEAQKTNLFKGEKLNNYFRELSFGFFGEIGGLLSALKKQKRDQLVLADAEVVAEELGDALWYLVSMTGISHIAVEKISIAAWDFLRAYFGEAKKSPPGRITFRVLDGICAQHHLKVSRRGEQLLRSLAQDAGKIVKLGHPLSSEKGYSNHVLVFGELLGKLALVSCSQGLQLDEVAHLNLSKISDRWPGDSPTYPAVKAIGETYEQFPSKLEVVFIQRKVGGRTVVVQQINGINIGDPLTDNSYKPDGYRFHDVFHLAYAVHLGWSPVIRALLKLKRKSDSRVDENEDGARALIIEEGIATWIFNHSCHHSPKYYAGAKLGRLDYFLLKQVRSLVAGFEVSNAPLWQWERAVLDGFAVFRQLLHHKGGTVVADLGKHTLHFIPPQYKS